MEMGEERVKRFAQERQDLNEVVMKYAGLGTKRFFNLDTQAYEPGALDKKTKEMLGLVASFVLRCDDCVTYHIIRCKEEGITDEELEEILNVGLVVGGSITIPHMRKAYKAWEELKNEEGVSLDG
jgi:AhpD family alkylhydroperoxidase